jgi:hypothetical protein
LEEKESEIRRSQIRLITDSKRFLIKGKRVKKQEVTKNKNEE